MAGHWIKWEKGLTRKPEIIRIARALRVPPDQAAGICMRVWEWADDVTIEGLLVGVTMGDLDAAVQVPGVAAALLACGWLVESESCIQFPNYKRHNGNSAKRRATDREYQTKKRQERALVALLS